MDDDLARLERGDYAVEVFAVENGWWQAHVREIPAILTAQPTRQRAESALQDAIVEWVAAVRG